MNKDKLKAKLTLPSLFTCDCGRVEKYHPTKKRCRICSDIIRHEKLNEYARTERISGLDKKVKAYQLP